MKKILLLVSFTFVSFVTFAQSVQIGITGGPVFSKFVFPASYKGLINPDYKITYALGVFADIRFGNFSVEPALNYVGSGGQFEVEPGNLSSLIHYFQVPVNFTYRVKIHSCSIYFGGGPYFSLGASATDYLDDNEGNTESNSQSFGGANGEYAKTETGLDAIAGIQFKSGFLIRFNYDSGLSNVLNSNFGADDGLVIHTRSFGISAGYAF